MPFFYALVLSRCEEGQKGHRNLLLAVAWNFAWLLVLEET